MSATITQVNVNQQVAPTPPTLQQTGAFISQGGTTTSPGTKTLLTQLSDLTPVLAGSHAVTSIAQTGGTATVTATSPHGFTVSDTLYITIAGASPAAYNGTHLCTVTTTTAFTFAIASGTSTPATGTIVYTVEDVAELMAMATTFFAQGSSVGVYVLELGPGSPADGVTYLTAWITANPGVFYSYLVPRTWDGVSSYLAMVANFQSTTAKTYFFTTTTLATYSAYTNLQKAVFAEIECPVYGKWPANVLSAISYSGGLVTGTTTTAHGVVAGNYFSISGCTPAGYNGTFLALTGTTGSTLVYALLSDPGVESVLGTLVASPYASAGIPATEFSAAATFWDTLHYNPSATNKVPPLAFTYQAGVTPFPVPGNAALLSTLKADSINVVGTGAQGGISLALILWGTTMDGRPFNYWYSVDWVQINATLNANNAVINGSNNPINPLYLNQDGINRVQAVIAATMASAVTFGLALGSVVQTELSSTDFANALENGAFAGKAVVNAVPFVDYYTANPGDYRTGTYNGYSITYVPLRGFQSITINITVTDFVTA